jgi:hypothetical protein
MPIEELNKMGDYLKYNHCLYIDILLIEGTEKYAALYSVLRLFGLVSSYSYEVR